ncbi:MAG: hemolysin [Solirubrobacteraceae bacterium]|nr:hemolysin [Solirubrobacteraceae bacterium]
MNDVIPVLRGVSHFWTVWFALAGAVVLVVLADAGAPRISAVVYGVGLCSLFGGSALYHRWRWNPRWRPLLRRVDHSTIFVFIAASYTPIGLVVMDGPMQVVVLALVWAGALAGVVFSLAWIDAPRWLQAVLYVTLGWVAVIALPQLVGRMHVAPLLLLGVGGVLYTTGAVVYARQRPDPWPATFGYHEIFHAFVIAAAVCHFVAMAGWVLF